jgi:hypothetical protein
MRFTVGCVARAVAQGELVVPNYWPAVWLATSVYSAPTVARTISRVVLPETPATRPSQYAFTRCAQQWVHSQKTKRPNSVGAFVFVSWLVHGVLQLAR